MAERRAPPPPVLVLGRNGQLGFELQRALAPLGPLIAMDRSECDLAQPRQVQEVVRRIKPAAIVNAAAYTAVDKAESEIASAFAINAEAPALLGQLAVELDALLVHYSTDYVFDGSGTEPWTEDAPTRPLNVYGSSKLAGEQAILASGCSHFIFRTTWVYGVHGTNFAKTMLRLASERDTLRIIADQFGVPTSAALIADVTAHALRRYPLRRFWRDRRKAPASGIYHLAPAGETTWNGYARLILQTAQEAGMALKAGPDAVEEIPSSAYPTPARRPFNSRLDCTRLQREFGLRLPLWEPQVVNTVRLIHELQQ